MQHDESYVLVHKSFLCGTKIDIETYTRRVPLRTTTECVSFAMITISYMHVNSFKVCDKN